MRFTEPRNDSLPPVKVPPTNAGEGSVVVVVDVDVVVVGVVEEAAAVVGDVPWAP
jgi:hypothetical protein